MSQAAVQSSKRNKRDDPAVEAKLRVATARSVLRDVHKHISAPSSRMSLRSGEAHGL
jgi:hypothetical protein